MEINYCLDINRLVAGIGLCLDVLAVCILLKNEIVLRKIELLSNQGLDKKSLVDYYEEGLIGEEKRESTPIPKETLRARELSEKHTPLKALNYSNIGFALLLIGFALQLISLFLYSCISINF